MRIIKLKLFPVPVRFHFGSGLLNFVLISPRFVAFKNVVHSLESGERRLTRLQTMHNVLKNCKTFIQGCGSDAVIFSIYVCSVL